MTTCPANCGTDSPDGLLCQTCTGKLEQALGDVPALVAELDVTMSRQDRVARVGGGRRDPDPNEEPGLSPMKSTRSPVNWGAANVMDDLTNTLVTWARDVLGGRTTGSMVTHAAVASSCVLLSHVPEIRRHPAVDELLDEILDAVSQARRAVDRPADRQYLGQCMTEFEGVTCYEEIYARHGASEAVCKVCGITHEVGERRAWLLQKAQDMLVTVREASSYMGEVGGITVTQAAIRGYLHRGKIGYRAGNTIRLGDLLTVVVDESERRSA